MKVTPDQARRIVTLDDASDGITSLRLAMRDRKPDAGHDRVVLQIAVMDMGRGGGFGRALMELDLDTADLLLPMVEKLIRDELAKLGAGA